MAINPTGYPMPGAFMTDIDFSPLTRLGERISDTMKRNREEEEASKLIAQLYDRSGQQSMMTPQAAPARAGGGAIQTSMLPPVPGYNLSGNPTAAPQAPPQQAAAPQAPAPFGAPADPPAWLQSGTAGNYNPAPPQQTIDPRSPVGRLMARLGKGVSPDSMPAPFPAGGTSPVPGIMPDNAVPVAPEPPWYNPQIARALSTFGGGAPPQPGDPQPPWPGGPPPQQTATAPPPVPLPQPRPATPDVALQPQPSPAQPAYPEAGQPAPVAIDNALRVIRQKESSNNYRNVTTTQNRSGHPQSAIGAYGVMDFNVGPWTKEVLGRELTRDEFLHNDAAQDAVARAKFSQYASRYGLTGAAKAWFAGERGMHNPDARDPLGTSVSAYASDFDRKVGGGGLPSEITAGTSRPTGEPNQRMALDAEATAATPSAAYGRAVQNLASPQPASAAELSSEEMAALYRNPLTRPIAQAFLQKRLDPGQYDFVVAGDQLYRVNKRTGSSEPIPIHQKLMTVGENDRVYDPNKREFVGGDSDSGKYGKLPANTRWVDPNDKSKGVVAIEGGPATQLPAETAAKIGLGRAFLTRLPDIKQKIEGGALGIDVNAGGHLAAINGVGEGAQLKRQIDSGADALLRMLTGAGMGIQEAHNYAMRYAPTVRDTKDQLLSKLQQLEEEIHFTAQQIGQGHGGSPLGDLKRSFGAPAAAAPGAAPAAAAPGAQAAPTIARTKVLNGVTYGQIGDKWYQLNAAGQ